METDIKEVQMDMPTGSKGRKGRRSRKARSEEGGDNQVVEKAPEVVHKKSRPSTTTATAPASSTNPTNPTNPKVAGAGAVAVAPKVVIAPPKVVIAPPKKKPARVLLIAGTTKMKKEPRKTFRAKMVRVVIDNTAKTQKRRRQSMQRIDVMTDEQIRAACLAAKLSRTETVAKVPIGLLRQMLKDYQSMRGGLL
jgi:uncharacterized membrane protein